MQYGNAGLLLSPEAMMTGLPQRFAWFRPTSNPTSCHTYGPRCGAASSVGRSAGGSRIEVLRCRQAGHRGAAGEAHRGHRVPVGRHKLPHPSKASPTPWPFWNGHYSSVREEDWELSGIVMAVSDATRKRAVDTCESSRKQPRRRALEGLRWQLPKLPPGRSGQPHRRLVERWLQSQTGGTRSDLRKRLRSDKRDHLMMRVELLDRTGPAHRSGQRLFVTP